MNHEEQVQHTSHSYSKYVIAAAIIIASIKSYLVLTVFMHLKVESKAFKIFLIAALFFIIISFVLLFSDYSTSTQFKV